MTRLCSSPQLRDLKIVLDGRAEIVVRKYIVDLDADPFVPQGLTLVKHEKGGKFEFDPIKIKLYLSPNQQDGGMIGGASSVRSLRNSGTSTQTCLTSTSHIPTSFLPSGKTKWCSSGVPSTATRMATTMCATSTGTVVSGSRVAPVSTVSGTAKILRRSRRISIKV